MKTINKNDKVFISNTMRELIILVAVICGCSSMPKEKGFTPSNNDIMSKSPTSFKYLNHNLLLNFKFVNSLYKKNTKDPMKCGDIVLKNKGITVRDLLEEDSDLAVVSRVVFAESHGDRRNKNYFHEKEAIAWTIQNRYDLVNYRRYIKDDDGFFYEPKRLGFVSRRANYGNVSYKEVVSHRNEFTVVKGHGDWNLTYGFQKRLNYILNLKLDDGLISKQLDPITGEVAYSVNERCSNLLHAINTTYMVMRGNIKDPNAKQGRTLFFNLGGVNPSLMTKRFSKGSTTVFFGLEKNWTSIKAPQLRPIGKPIVMKSLGLPLSSKLLASK